MKLLSERDENFFCFLIQGVLNRLVGMKLLSERDENSFEDALNKLHNFCRNEATL